MTIKSWFKKVKEKPRTKRRDLDFFESDLTYLLKTVFVKVEISEGDLTKKLRLRDKEKFELLSNFALSPFRRYLDVEHRDGIFIYTITNRGIEYLLWQEKIKGEEKRADTIKWATIVLAIAAFIQAIDIWVYKPQTKETILLLIIKTIGATLTLIKDLIPLAIVILVGWIIFKIVNEIRTRKKT